MPHFKKKNPQLSFLKKSPTSYGGVLLKTRQGRSRARPLDSQNTMHLVLRSSRAKGEKSFRTPKNAKLIQAILSKFSFKYGIQILSLANVGNHLHLHIKLSNRYSYKPFIRATTSAIAVSVGQKNRWNQNREKFWDYRPFTRVVVGLKTFLNLKNYIEINQLEGLGLSREGARFVAWRVLSPVRTC